MFGLAAFLRAAPKAQHLVFHLWPEHVQAFALFQSVQTQWRMGPVGPTGFDYASLRAHPAVRAWPHADRERLLGELAILESGFLDAAAAIRAAAVNAPT